PSPHSPAFEKASRPPLAVPKLLAPTIDVRIEAVERGTFSQHAIGTVCFDLRIRRAHAAIGQFAREVVGSLGSSPLLQVTHPSCSAARKSRRGNIIVALKAVSFTISPCASWLTPSCSRENKSKPSPSVSRSSRARRQPSTSTASRRTSLKPESLSTLNSPLPMIEPPKSRTRGQAKRCGRVAIATIEPLEARVAPASLTFTDVDGDLVTVTTSKGSNIELAAIVTKANEGIGEELRLINFALNSATQAAFAGTNLTVTAKRTSLGGDGFVNVGYIEAIGIDLGKVVIRGDLGVIDAGDGVRATGAIKSLSVQSLGRFGLDTGAPDLKSDIDGRVGKLVVKSDVDQAFARVIDSGGANGKIGSITIGGSVIGGVAGSSGRIDSDDGIGPVRIGGGIVGGAGI